MSASPPESSGLPDKPTREQIKFKFCNECSNMLYPKEDRQTHQLMFACSTCQYSEKASSSCVFRNNLDTTIGETAGVTQDVGSDPTVGIPGFCALCRLPIRCSFCDEMSSEGIMVYVEEQEEEEDDDDDEEEKKEW